MHNRRRGKCGPGLPHTQRRHFCDQSHYDELQSDESARRRADDYVEAFPFSELWHFHPDSQVHASKLVHSNNPRTASLVINPVIYLFTLAACPTNEKSGPEDGAAPMPLAGLRPSPHALLALGGIKPGGGDQRALEMGPFQKPGH